MGSEHMQQRTISSIHRSVNIFLHKNLGRGAEGNPGTDSVYMMVGTSVHPGDLPPTVGVFSRLGKKMKRGETGAFG